MASKNPASEHNQPLSSPIEHFKSIPWCSAILTQKSILQVSIPDRTPLPSTESALVRETLNTSKTVKACVTYLRFVSPKERKAKGVEGTEGIGEDKKNPFLEVGALVDLQNGVNGYANTVHGGFFGVVLDEVMGTAANMQAEHGALTAALTVKFKRPLYTPSIVVCKGQVIKKEGKKLFVKGSFEDKDGNLVAVADGMWIIVDKDIGRSNVSKL